MGYVYYNPNPAGKMVGDCVIRAISAIENKTWEDVFVELMSEAYRLFDMPSSNYVWDSYLKSIGYIRKNLPDTCPDCYTLRQFTKDYPNGKFIVATGTHVIAVIKGSSYDSWDSSDEVVSYYYEKYEKKEGNE